MTEMGRPSQETWTSSQTPRLNIKQKLVRRNRDGHYMREIPTGVRHASKSCDEMRIKTRYQVQIDLVNLEPSSQI